jgi:hypothetical protein
VQVRKGSVDRRIVIPGSLGKVINQLVALGLIEASQPVASSPTIWRTTPYGAQQGCHQVAVRNRNAKAQRWFRGLTVNLANFRVAGPSGCWSVRSTLTPSLISNQRSRRQGKRSPRLRRNNVLYLTMASGGVRFRVRCRRNPQRLRPNCGILSPRRSSAFVDPWVRPPGSTPS